MKSTDQEKQLENKEKITALYAMADKLLDSKSKSDHKLAAKLIQAAKSLCN